VEDPSSVLARLPLLADLSEDALLLQLDWFVRRLLCHTQPEITSSYFS
jgi:hypothetical protein